MSSTNNANRTTVNTAIQYMGSASSRFWHIATRKESIGPVSGKVLAVYYVTACSGRQLGGPYGQTVSNTAPATDDLCPRCARFAAK